MVIRKEALAVKWMVEALHYYLLGGSFVVVTDHTPLKWRQTIQDTNAGLMWWYLILQPFAFTVQHRAGREHANTDSLSWLEDADKASPEGRARQAIPPLQKQWGRTESIKDGPYSSVGLELVKETATSCPLLGLAPEGDLCSAEDLKGLPELPVDKDTEELLGLPLAMYPGETEDPHELKVPSERIIGRTPGNNLVV